MVTGLKRAIAAHVAAQLTSDSFKEMIRTNVFGRDNTQATVRCTVVDDLNIQIQVRTDPKGAPRYFNVKVSEPQ